MGLTAHCSMIGFFFPVFSCLGPFPLGLSSIAILLPFLINLLFTTSTTFPIYWGTDDPGGHSSSHSPPHLLKSFIQHPHSCLTIPPSGFGVSRWLLSFHCYHFTTADVWRNKNDVHHYLTREGFCFHLSLRKSVTKLCKAWLRLVWLHCVDRKNI